MTDRERIARIIDPEGMAIWGSLQADPPTDADDPRLFEPGLRAADVAFAKADSILALRPDVGGVPAGFKLVPIEPTEKMLRAAFAAMNETPAGTWKRMKAEGSTPRRLFDVKMAPRYRAMLSCAPSPPEGEG